MNAYKGQRVITKTAVDKFPNFIVPMYELGTVDTVGKQTIFVKMDRIIPGCDEWDNCVHCEENEFNHCFADAQIFQLESALTIIFENDDKDVWAAWLKTTCTLLREAGSNHYAIARVLT